MHVQLMKQCHRRRRSGRKVPHFFESRIFSSPAFFRVPHFFESRIFSSPAFFESRIFCNSHFFSACARTVALMNKRFAGRADVRTRARVLEESTCFLLQMPCSILAHVLEYLEVRKRPCDTAVSPRTKSVARHRRATWPAWRPHALFSVPSRRTTCRSWVHRQVAA